MTKVLVIIPAFNEASALSQTLRALHTHAPDYDVLVIDDGSEDTTAATASREGAVVVSHPFNMGYGTALQTGYRYALSSGYDLAVQIDSDGQHDPADAPRLAAPILESKADAVYGSRFHAGSTYNMPFLRRLGSSWLRMLVWWLTGLSVNDPTTGMQALSRRVLQLYVTDAFPADYPDADMIVLLHRNGFRLTEVPVQMRERPESISMHAGLKIIYYAYKMTLAMIMNAVRPRVRTERVVLEEDERRRQ